MATEKVGVVGSDRKSDDILAGAFGTPNSAVDIKQAFTGTAAAITTMRKYKFYRFLADQDCHVLFSAAGDATVSNMLIRAGVPEVFNSADNERVSVIRDVTSGNLYVTELQTNPRIV